MSAFLALVESGQFKLAAERCHVSQSAFSQMISRPERNSACGCLTATRAMFR